jgi:hypothetical protein
VSYQGVHGILQVRANSPWASGSFPSFLSTRGRGDGDYFFGLRYAYAETATTTRIVWRLVRNDILVVSLIGRIANARNPSMS